MLSKIHSYILLFLAIFPTGIVVLTSCIDFVMEKCVHHFKDSSVSDNNTFHFFEGIFLLKSKKTDLPFNFPCI